MNLKECKNKLFSGKKSTTRIFLENLIGFLIFMLILGVLNILLGSIQSPTFHGIVEFFNSQIKLIVLITILGMLLEIFWNYKFPINLPAPIFSSIFGILILTLVLRMLSLAGFELANIFAQQTINLFYMVIFVIIIAFGYIKIAIALIKKVVSIKKIKNYKKKFKNIEEERKNKLKKQKNRKV